MNIEQQIDAQIQALSNEYPFFRSYRFNEFKAPHLSGGSPVDLGMALIFLEELEAEANNKKMSNLLSVTELTCKNWITKLREECYCVVDWHTGIRVGRLFKVKSHGIFNVDLYDQFRPYVKLVIQNWRNQRNEQQS